MSGVVAANRQKLIDMPSQNGLRLGRTLALEEHALNDHKLMGATAT